jgi:predicted glycosyltransferase
MKNKSIRILFDLGHPAHVHLFRNVIRKLQSNGHSVIITIRDKDITAKLLDIYGFTYTKVSKARKSNLGLFYELMQHNLGVLNIANRHKSQLLIGTSVSVAHVAKLIGAKSLVFSEDDASVAKTFSRLTYPFADAIITPDCIEEDYGTKHFKYAGYQKLAYLHPKYFYPDPSIKCKLGLNHHQFYFIIRLVSLTASHDRGEKGINFDALIRIIEKLSENGRVFITSENTLPKELEIYGYKLDPTDIHDALYYSNFFIGDSQSMAVEAAILGVPSIRINSFAKRISVLQELEHKYELCSSFFPSQEEDYLDLIDKWIKTNDLHEKWKLKKEKMLAEKIDVAAWIIEFIENYKDKII